MTIPECVVDLSQDDDIPAIPLKSDSDNIYDKKLLLRPASLTLKNLGVSLIKLQYSENKFNDFDNQSNKGIVLKKKEDLWQIAWATEPKEMVEYPLQHLLEDRFVKTYNCVMYRSPFCEKHMKITRIASINHHRRGHVRISGDWRKILKQCVNPSMVIEIFCLHCSENRRRKCVAWNPFNYIQHMKKYHPHILPINDHFAYFQRCFICNDQTKSFQQNLSHRQLCLGVLMKDPNQVGTSQFNNCFKGQRTKSTASLDISVSIRNAFDSKVKLLSTLKCSFNFYLQSRRNGVSESLKSCQNGLLQQPTKLSAALNTLRQNIWSNQMFMNCRGSVSERILPGTVIDHDKRQKFFMPISFLLKNDLESRTSFAKWRKSFRPEHGDIQSAVPCFCELCNAMLKNARSAYCHMKMCHIAEFREMTCKSCSKKFLSSQGFKNHFNGTKKCPVTRRCITCNASVSISDIYEHMFIKHKEDFADLLKIQSCLICRAKVDNIRCHLFDIHGMSNVIQAQPNAGKVNYRNGVFFNCTKCSMTYFTEIELRNHILQESHYLECPQCPSLKFSLSWELMNHLNTSHSPDDRGFRYGCELCDAGDNASFVASSDQVRHYTKTHLTPCTVVLSDIGDHH